MDKRYELSIDVPSAELLVLELRELGGTPIERVEYRFSGHVDNLLLTSVDNLLKRSNVDRFALIAVVLGTGIDKSSSLYRIVQSFAAAIAAAR